MNKEKIVSIRMPDDLYEKFIEICNEDYRSISDYIRALMVQELKRKKNEKI